MAKENYLKMVDEGLRKYVEQNIFPLYEKVDKGHNIANHILPVILESLELASQISNSLYFNMVYVIAAYHDIGLIINRKFHHIYSKDYLLRDNNLLYWFSESQLQEMAMAILEHRASSKKIPSNIYGMILADSDKCVKIEEIILRTHYSVQTKYPNDKLDTFEKEFQKAYEWILEKDSKNGTLNFYLNQEKQKQLAKLHELVLDEPLIRSLYLKIYEK